MKTFEVYRGIKLLETVKAYTLKSARHQAKKKWGATIEVREKEK